MLYLCVQWGDTFGSPEKAVRTSSSRLSLAVSPPVVLCPWTTAVACCGTVDWGCVGVEGASKVREGSGRWSGREGGDSLSLSLGLQRSRGGLHPGQPHDVTHDMHKKQDCWKAASQSGCLWAVLRCKQ